MPSWACFLGGHQWTLLWFVGVLPMWHALPREVLLNKLTTVHWHQSWTERWDCVIAVGGSSAVFRLILFQAVHTYTHTHMANIVFGLFWDPQSGGILTGWFLQMVCWAVRWYQPDGHMSFDSERRWPSWMLSPQTSQDFDGVRRLMLSSWRFLAYCEPSALIFPVHGHLPAVLDTHSKCCYVRSAWYLFNTLGHIQGEPLKFVCWGVRDAWVPAWAPMFFVCFEFALAELFPVGGLLEAFRNAFLRFVLLQRARSAWCLPSNPGFFLRSPSLELPIEYSHKIDAQLIDFAAQNRCSLCTCFCCPVGRPAQKVSAVPKAEDLRLAQKVKHPMRCACPAHLIIWVWLLGGHPPPPPKK